MKCRILSHKVFKGVDKLAPLTREAGGCEDPFNTGLFKQVLTANPKSSYTFLACLTKTCFGAQQLGFR